MKCPYCESDEIELIDSPIIRGGTSAQCLDCGLTGPAVDNVNENVDQDAFALFSSISIDQPAMRVKYSSNKPKFSVGANLYVLACIIVICVTLFLVVYGAPK